MSGLLCRVCGNYFNPCPIHSVGTEDRLGEAADKLARSVDRHTACVEALMSVVGSMAMPCAVHHTNEAIDKAGFDHPTKSEIEAALLRFNSSPFDADHAMASVLGVFACDRQLSHGAKRGPVTDEEVRNAWNTSNGAIGYAPCKYLSDARCLIEAFARSRGLL